MPSYCMATERLKDVPLHQLTGSDRVMKLWALHPETSPEISEPLPYLIHPPSQWATTEQHERFHKMLVELIAYRPEDAHYPLFLACSERVLAWRATLAPEDRYWETWPRRRVRR